MPIGRIQTRRCMSLTLRKKNNGRKNNLREKGVYQINDTEAELLKKYLQALLKLSPALKDFE